MWLIPGNIWWWGNVAKHIWCDKGFCMHNRCWWMNQTARPKAYKCIWQSGFTTSMNHQTFGHASAKSRMKQDSFLPHTASNPNSPFSRFSRFPFWEGGAVDISPFYQDFHLVAKNIVTIFTILIFHKKSNHPSDIFEERCDVTVPHWALNVYVPPFTGSRRRLRSSVRGTQRTARVCFENVKEGVTWEEEWMDGSILSAQWIPS